MSLTVVTAGDTMTLVELAAADPAVRFSPHCWKTRMALAHKGLSVICQPWRFADRGGPPAIQRVPVLVWGTDRVEDSWEIARYLDVHFADRPLLFTPDTLSLIRFVNAWVDAQLDSVGRLIVLDVYECLDHDDRAYFRETRERHFGMALEEIVADQPARMRELDVAFRPLRSLLRKQSYVHGEEPGYGDYCAFGLFMWVRCCRTEDVLQASDPIFRWRESLLDLFDGLGRNAPRVNDR